MSTQVLKCNPNSITFTSSGIPECSCTETASNLQKAAEQLSQLKPVVMPTETVYGLAASALSTTAVSRIYSVKGRPPDNPLIVHVSSLQMLESVLPPNFKMPPIYTQLMQQFWPGALTLLFPASHVFPQIVTSKLPTVAMRMPSHTVSRALISIAGVPLAAPSANSSGKPSPTKAEHVLRDLDGKVGIILDAGPCSVGIESTVVDGLNDDGIVRILRPGGVTVESIERALRESGSIGKVPHSRVVVHGRDFKDAALEAAPTTPGMKYKHYSPSMPVTLLCTNSAPPDAQKNSVQIDTYFQSLVKGQAKKIGLLCSDDSELLQHARSISGIEWHVFRLEPTSQNSKKSF